MKKNNNEKIDIEKVNALSDPEVIDAIIKAKLATFIQKGGKSYPKLNAWTDKELELRDTVILQYITEQGMSRERTAQQLVDRWGITKCVAVKYVKQAIDRFCETYADNNREHQIKLWNETLMNVLQMAIEDRTKDSALKALDLLGKSLGLFKEKNEITLNGGENPIEFDFK